LPLVRDEELPRLSSDGFARYRAALFFGTSEGRISDAVRSTLSEFSKKGAEIVRLLGQVCVSDPSLLDTALRSTSFFAGRQIVVVEGAVDGLAGQLEALLDIPQNGNFLILQGGNLSKTSALRQKAEQSSVMAACALYDPVGAQVSEEIVRRLRNAGFAVEAGAADVLAELVGDDVALLAGECEKLALFAHGQTEIAVADVRSVCGMDSAFRAEGLVDESLLGHLDEVGRQLGAADEQELQLGLMNLGSHAALLAGLRSEADRSGSVSSAVRNARPPIFFRRQSVVSRQLEVWQLNDLQSLQGQIGSAQELSRKQPALAASIIGRLFLQVAWAARR
jgi:DNA polymerase-3 subunit delta